MVYNQTDICIIAESTPKPKTTRLHVLKKRMIQLN